MLTADSREQARLFKSEQLALKKAAEQRRLELMRQQADFIATAKTALRRAKRLLLVAAIDGKKMGGFSIRLAASEERAMQARVEKWVIEQLSNEGLAVFGPDGGTITALWSGAGGILRSVSSSTGQAYLLRLTSLIRQTAKAGKAIVLVDVDNRQLGYCPIAIEDLAEVVRAMGFRCSIGKAPSVLRICW